MGDHVETHYSDRVGDYGKRLFDKGVAFPVKVTGNGGKELIKEYELHQMNTLCGVKQTLHI